LVFYNIVVVLINFCAFVDLNCNNWCTVCSPRARGMGVNRVALKFRTCWQSVLVFVTLLFGGSAIILKEGRCEHWMLYVCTSPSFIVTRCTKV